jgi:hypothetical protein
MYEVKSGGRGYAVFGEYRAQRSRVVYQEAVGPGT